MSASDPETIRILPAAALGDGLLGMVLAANLKSAGRDVVIHHGALGQLAAWYPDMEIRPALDPDGAPLARLLASDAPLFIGDPAWMKGREEDRHYVFHKRDWDRSQHVLENLRRGADRHFGLPRPDDNSRDVVWLWQNDYGLLAPEDSPRGSHPARVCLHPSSARPNKNWPAGQFLSLADRLAAEGHEPVFLSAAEEARHWQEALGERYEIVVPGTLDRVAAYLRACGGAIVTDSGIGHLAAAVGTPTLSLFRKKSSARFWRPCGTYARAISASVRLPGGTGHRHWARFLTPRSVHAMYRDLVSRTTTT